MLYASVYLSLSRLIPEPTTCTHLSYVLPATAISDIGDDIISQACKRKSINAASAVEIPRENRHKSSSRDPDTTTTISNSTIVNSIACEPLQTTATMSPCIQALGYTASCIPHTVPPSTEMTASAVKATAMTVSAVKAILAWCRDETDLCALFDDPLLSGIVPLFSLAFFLSLFSLVFFWEYVFSLIPYVSTFLSLGIHAHIVILLAASKIFFILKTNPMTLDLTQLLYRKKKKLRNNTSIARLRR